MTIYHRDHTDLTELLESFNYARWTIACREMEVRIARGHFQAAIRRLEAFMVETEPGYATLDSHVMVVLPLRLAFALEEQGFSTLRAVHRATDSQLRVIPNVGIGAVEHARKVINDVIAGRVVEVPADEDFEAHAEESHRLKMTDAQIDFEVNRLAAAIRKLKRTKQVRNGAN